MPKLLLEVPDTEASTARPVTLEIIRQIMAATGIDKNTTILYPSEDGEQAQLGSRIGDDGEKNKFPSTNKVIVDVEEEYVPERILSSAVYRPENNFVFLDQNLGVYIKPVYTSTSVTINFRYRTRDKVLARRWRDEIKNRFSMSRDVFVHDSQYHFLVPPEFIFILQEIHRLREAQAGYGDVFDDYFKNNATQRLTLLTNLSGSKDAWAISETQQRIQGWFNFEGVPESGNKENDTDAWTISFSYNFRYDKAVACVMQYPLMIHNQTLSKKFRDTKQAPELEHKERSYALSVWHLAHFEKMSRIPQNPLTTGVGIPEIDDFIPAQVLPNTMRVVTALVKLTETDKRTLLDLKQLGKYTLNEVFMDFLQNSEAPYVTKPFASIINISVYRGVNIVPDRYVNMNNQGIVSVTEDLNLRDYHHVRLSLCTDLTSLSPAAIDRLRNNSAAFCAIMRCINPYLFEDGLITDALCRSGYITRDQFFRVVDYMERGNYAKGDRQDHQFNTVMSLSVQADRLEHA